MGDFNLDDIGEDDIELDKAPAEVPGDKSGVGIMRDSGNAILVPVQDNAAVLRKDSTAGMPMKRFELPKGINQKDFRDVVAGAYLAYTDGNKKYRGEPPNPEEVEKFVNLSLRRIQTIMALPAFRDVCEARGIAYSKKAGITQEQDFALQIILDPSFNGGLEQRLKKARVSMSKYRAWLKQPAFRHYLENVGSSTLKDFEANMMVALANRASNGDVNAIKYAFEVTGRHDPAQRQVMDGQRLMLQLVEVLKTHIKDPELLNAIGADLVLLSNAAGLNQQTPLEIED